LCWIKIAQPPRSGYLESLGPQEHGMLESVLSCSAIGGGDAVRRGLEAFIARTGDEDFLNEVRKLPERNLAVELLERLIEGEIKTRFATNGVQNNKFSEMLTGVIKRYQNRSIETAQVMEELIAMATRFKEEAQRGEHAGLNADELAFYDALADNEESVRELGDETLKKIAHELAESLRNNVSVDWAVRESVRAKLRLMVKRILRKYKYPPVKQEAAVALVLAQAEALSAEWA
jgi:type I restriction enzyme R subunit